MAGSHSWAPATPNRRSSAPAPALGQHSMHPPFRAHVPAQSTGTAEAGVSRREAPYDDKVHSRCCPETGLNLPVGEETTGVGERASVRVASKTIRSMPRAAAVAGAAART